MGLFELFFKRKKKEILRLKEEVNKLNNELSATKAEFEAKQMANTKMSIKLAELKKTNKENIEINNKLKEEKRKNEEANIPICNLTNENNLLKEDSHKAIKEKKDKTKEMAKEQEILLKKAEKYKNAIRDLQEVNNHKNEHATDNFQKNIENEKKNECVNIPNDDDCKAFFENLNENQKIAVATTEGKVRVVAGAGSGKTKVLVNRFAYLVEYLGINPANILCMTFTNKAAQEMRSRISKLVHTGNMNDFICTIHGFCVKLLRRDIYRIGFPRNFMILDDADAKSLAKRVFEEFRIERSDVTIKNFLESVNLFKVQAQIVRGNYETYIERYMLPDSKMLKKDDKNPIIKYLRLQLKTFALDFYDIIAFAIFILDHFEDARDYWQNELNYIQVDEVQDCNGSDWKLIDILCQKHGNLFVVGDPDQAIYEWRGAIPDRFVNYKPDVDIVLNENYRSTPNILNVANSIIVNNKNRIEKELFTRIPQGRNGIYFHGKNEWEEAEWIVKQIEELNKSGNGYGDFAILYRSSYLSRPIEQMLMKNNINYTVWGGIRFFERKEIKDALSYLRLVAYGDDLSFERVVNEPRRGFGSVSMEKLRNIADEEKASMYNTLYKHKNDGIFNKKELHAFIEMIEDCKNKKDEYTISDLLENILLRSKIKESLRKDGDEERLENLAELVNSIKFYEEVNQDNGISLDSYLQDIALYTNADYKKNEESVKLMTIHQAKGLEFPYVFVCGMTEGVFPSHRSIRERSARALEEERRLMYVATTRAEKMLFLTDSEGFNFSTRSDKFPSRFILEIKDGLIKVEGNVGNDLLEGTRRMVKESDPAMNTGTKTFNEGDEVSHRVFGKGKILEKKENGMYYKVLFGNSEKVLNGSSLIEEQ